MNNKKLSLALITALIAFAGCKRDFKVDTPDNNSTNNSINGKVVAAKDIVVPANFNFETEKELSIRVKVATPVSGQRYVIKVYSNVPSTGELITTGITDANAEFSTKIRVAAWEEFVYIEKINPDGSSSFERVKVAPFVSTLFKDNEKPNPFIFRKSGSGMNCSTGCTNSYNNRSSNITVNNGETVCLTGTFSGNIDIKVKSGGVLRVCASGSFDELKIEGSGKAYILEGAVINPNKIKVYDEDAKLYNWSDSVVIDDEFEIKGYAENNGKIYSNKHIEIKEDGIAKNYGTLTTIGSSDKDILVEGKLYNYHYIYVGNDLKIEEDGYVYNYCQIQVNDDLENDGYLWSNCYIKVGDNFEQKDKGDTKLDNGAFLSTKDFYLKKYIEGTGSNNSKIKVSATTTLNSGSKVKGKIDLCDSTGVETNNGTIQSPAALSCTGYLASSTCQPETFGQPTVQDADNDGVPDAQDEYPNDADRAFNSYYPNATTTSTLAFEDLWPSQGDYDYNDLTLAFNIQKVLNADNEVVDMKVKMKVRSVGASFDNGFGFQLDEVVPGDIQTVTGQLLTRNIVTLSSNKTEAGQAKAVIICYDSPEPSMQRTTGSMFNTIQANGVGSSDTIRINVSFSNPVVDSKMGIEDFNPFIFTNRRRAYEVHLGNFAPTDLADTQLFGTFNDRSNPSNGTYYKNANGMPWAILLPEDFVYPQERIAITDAYNFFDDWAISGGTTNTNWYTNSSGNRNILKLFGLQ